MKTLIIIPNYNGKRLLEKNLPFLRKTKGSYDICVVDNGSSDGSVGFLEKIHPTIKIVKSEKNLGYGNAINLAVRSYPNYEYILFMNNDIRVEEDWLEKLLDVFKKEEEVGAVGPRILYSKMKEGRYVVNSAGMDINNHYMGYDRYEGEYDSEKFSGTEKVDGLCGAAVLVPKRVWDEVQGFNPNIFFYYEDADLSLRIRDLGYSIYYCGESIVYHDHMGTARSISSRKRNKMNMVSRHISIRDRLGIIMAMKETIWYLYSWSIWKIFFSKRITLKEFFEKNVK